MVWYGYTQDKVRVKTTKEKTNQERQTLRVIGLFHLLIVKADPSNENIGRNPLTTITTQAHL